MKEGTRKKLTFLGIGVINTLVDISIYTALVASNTLPIYWANLISSTTGIFCSYILNKTFTFKDPTKSNKRFFQYFAITALGLWVLQPIIIFGASKVFTELSFFDHGVWIALLPKCVATGVTLVWNYVLYERVVFKKQHEPVEK